jgi:nitrite reductase (NO-forming)/hydroxylamine reductase
MIDLWSSPPAAVANARGCLDARSVEASKYAGYEDQFLIEGCYWPPQYVVLDGATLEPLARVDVPRDTFDTAEVLPEVRVASIVASPFSPQWVLSFKETGYIALVDYSQPGFPIAARIPALRMLHDGGWDHSGRWFLVASATADGHVLAIDVADAELDASIATGNRPHPGRGANWLDPVYGWVNATVHLGEGKLAVYGADPDGRPEHAWQLVREIPLPAAGSLFLKTHDNSPYVFVDSPMAADPADARQVCAIAKATGTVERCFTPSNVGRAVHFEFNRAGDEVWVSAWNEEGELVIYDATTLEEIDRIGDLETPTGKFNVYNSAHDVY